MDEVHFFSPQEKIFPLCRHGGKNLFVKVKARKHSSVENMTSAGRGQEMLREEAQLVLLLVGDTESERNRKAASVLGGGTSTNPCNLAQSWNTGC